MLKKTTILFVFTIFVINFSFSQQLPIHNQILTNKFSLAPAYAGYSGHTECFTTYRQSWLGIEGAPKTAIINLNAHLLNNMGYGFSVIAENTGNFTQLYATAAYAYHIKFSENTALNIGLAPHIFHNQLNLSKVRSYGTQLDPMLQNSTGLTLTAFDVGISTVFILDNFNVGISVPRTIGMAFNYNDSEGQFQLQRHYIGFVSYGIGIGENIFLTPMAIIRTTEKSKINYEVSAFMEYKQRIWTGLGYRAGNSIAVTAGGAVGDRLILNYSYEFGFGGLSGAASGTHEFTLGFLFKQERDFKEPTIFPIPFDVQEQQSGNEEIEKKITILENMIKQEKQKRKNDVENLQRQIDSLKNIKNTNTNTNTNTNINWVQSEISPSITYGNTNRIVASSFGELDKYAQILKTDSKKKIKIVVYTDNVGSEQYNNEVSEKRAEAVANYLKIKPGVKSSQVYFEGKGEKEPIANNNTVEGRRQNNRTVIWFNEYTN